MNKICTKCGRELDISMFNKDKQKKYGISCRCKKCLKQWQRRHHNENKERINKEHKEYYEESKCRRREHNKQYRSDNKEMIIRQKKEYYEENKKAISEQHVDYCIKNKLIIAERNKNRYDKNKVMYAIIGKEYRENNIELVKKRHQKYAKENKDIISVTSQRYRTRKLKLPATLTIEQWDKAKQTFNNKCAYCNRELPLAQEHFLALSSGGEYTYNNIIPSCKSCNSSKGNRDFFAWYKGYKYYNKGRERKILKYLHYNNNIQQLAFSI